MGILEIVGGKREAILRIADEHGAREVRVFGSVARGDAGPESDVDFLVRLEEGRSLIDLGRILMELQDLLGRRVDLTEVGGLRPAIRDKILAEAIAL